MNLKVLNIFLCFMLVNILGNCTLSVSSQHECILVENATITFVTLEELRQDPNVIATYGRIPAFESRDERKQWLDSLCKIDDEITTNFKEEMSKNFYPNGPIVGYGFSIGGYALVKVDEEVDKPFMDDIYKIYDSHANLIGINEVPLVFFRGFLPVHVDAPAKADLSEVENSTNQQNKTESQSSEEKLNEISDFAPAKADLSEVENSTNQQNKTESQSSEDKLNGISGFSFLCGLCGLYIVYRTRC